MSLTISAQPAMQITNAPEFTVTTSLTESASYQNVRVRATIYVGGQSSAVAVLEQAKGLSSWDFFELLKSFCGKLNTAALGASQLITPTLSSELLTGWTNDGNFNVFTSTGRAISEATALPGVAAYAISNDLGTHGIGNVFVIAFENDFAQDSGDPILKLYNNTTERVKITSDQFISLPENNIFFWVSDEAITVPVVRIGSDETGGYTIEGTFSIKQINDFKNNPGVYFSVKFQEVYENTSNVTTISDTERSISYLFLPSKVRPGEDFDTDYVIDAADHKFLSRTEDSAGLYRFGIGMEMRILAACVAPYIQANILTDAGTLPVNAQNAGWAVVILNDTGSGVNADDTTIVLTLKSMNSAYAATHYTGPVIVITCETEDYLDPKSISFIGDLGEETILFRGLYTQTGKASKSFYQDQNRISKTLKAYRAVRMMLRTVYESEAVRLLLHELLYTESDVWMYDDDCDNNYRLVTVISDSTPIVDKKELIENEIEIEYYE